MDSWWSCQRKCLASQGQVTWQLAFPGISDPWGPVQLLPDQACARGLLSHLMPFLFILFPTLTISQP